MDALVSAPPGLRYEVEGSRMTKNTTSIVSCQGTSLIELPKRQLALFEHLGNLSEQQSAVIEQGNTESPLALLARRQRFAEELATVGTRLEPYRHQWPKLRTSLADDHSTQIDELINRCQKNNVGLITIDTYRIAAVDQLRTYANIMGIPLHVVLTPQDLTSATRQCFECDVVLIDTAGRSQRDDPKLEQLEQFIGAADPHEVHLVLSTTCTQTVLLDAVERFSKIRTDRIIFTKLDEAVTFGVLLNVAKRVKKQLSFLTTGQDVPHHIETSRSQRIAALVLGE